MSPNDDRKVEVILWLNGESFKGSSAGDALSALGRAQWVPCARQVMKGLLAGRCQALTGLWVDPLLPDDDFVGALHQLKFLRVDRVPRPGLTRYPGSGRLHP